MSTFRVNKNVNYTVMSNHHLQDKRLSLKAKGLLSYMLSLPDDWDYSLKGLTTGCRDGIDSVRSAVHEQEDGGYLCRSKVRGARGRIIDYNWKSTATSAVRKSVMPKGRSSTTIIRSMNRLLRTLLPFPARKAGHRTRLHPKVRKAA